MTKAKKAEAAATSAADTAVPDDDEERVLRKMFAGLSGTTSNTTTETPPRELRDFVGGVFSALGVGGRIEWDPGKRDDFMKSLRERVLRSTLAEHGVSGKLSYEQAHRVLQEVYVVERIMGS